MLSPVKSIQAANGACGASVRAGGVRVKLSGALTGIGRGEMLKVHGASDATGVITGKAQAWRFKSQGGGVIWVISGWPVTRLSKRSW